MDGRGLGLLRYLEQNRDLLERDPYGAQALIVPAGLLSGQEWSLCCATATDPQKGRRVASPVHPFYLVYIRDESWVRF